MLNPQTGAWKPNPLALVIVGSLGAAIGLTVQSDTYTFVKCAPNGVDRVLTIPSAAAYRVLGDRTFADVVALTVWLTLITGILLLIWKWFYRYVVEPERVRQFLANRKRQEALMQDLDEK